MVPDPTGDTGQESGCPKSPSTASRLTQMGLTGTHVAGFSSKRQLFLARKCHSINKHLEWKMFDLPYYLAPVGSWLGRRNHWLIHLIQPTAASAGHREGRVPGCHERPGLFASWQGVDQVLKLLCESLRRRVSKSLKAWTLTLPFFGTCLVSSYLQAPGGIFRMNSTKSQCLFLLVWNVTHGHATNGHGKGKVIANPDDSPMVLKITHPYESPGPSSARAGEASRTRERSCKAKGLRIPCG